MDKQMQVVNGVPMMGSRAIAEVTGKNHDHVKRDILAMLEQLKIYSPELEDSDFKGFIIERKEYRGRDVIDEIFLNENLSMTLVTGYDANRRLALIEQWRAMKEVRTQTRIAAQPAQQLIKTHNDMLSLARVVAEATASATMKVVMAMSSEWRLPPASSVSGVPDVPEVPQTNTSTEFVPVHKVSWETGLSDPSCRRLVRFANLPTGQLPGVRGLCVQREPFIHAFQVLLEESTRPSGKRKRWQHPEFGGFVLRKDAGHGE